MQKKTSLFSACGSTNKGFSFIELIVTAAIMSLVFAGLFSGFQVMTKAIGNSKAKAGALSLMTEKMEYIRSLSYNSIGTDGGVPAGAIAQTSTTTLNGIVYSERVLIQYIDDPADGIGGADSNGILADYKQTKVEYSWTTRGTVHTVALVSNIVPPGIESTAGGGTIRVNVFDATVTPVAGAAVRFVNDTTTTTIDTTRYTDLNGVVYLSGAPAAANYEITATDIGYSTDGTYTSTTSNPSPSTPPIAVLESQVSTMNFQIDQLSDLKITTVNPATYSSFVDTFATGALVATTSSTTVSGGAIALTGTTGTYPVSGFVQSTSTSPSPLHQWYSLSFGASTTASTSASVSVLYNNAGTMTLVPDADLSGNSTGFSAAIVDISSLDIATYPELALYGTLGTIDSNVTPTLNDWKLTYVTVQPTVAGVDIEVKGDKSIGTASSSQPVLKYSTTGTTNGSGELDLNNIEWDIYTTSVTSVGYSVYEICPTSPYSLSPGVSENISITLGAVSAQLLRVIVTETDGTPIANASVHLENTGVDQTSATSLCGQTYFNSGLYDDTNYLLTISAPGFSTQAFASTTVSSSSTVDVILN